MLSVEHLDVVRISATHGEGRDSDDVPIDVGTGGGQLVDLGEGGGEGGWKIVAKNTQGGEIGWGVGGRAEVGMAGIALRIFSGGVWEVWGCE